MENNTGKFRELCSVWKSGNHVTDVSISSKSRNSEEDTGSHLSCDLWKELKGGMIASPPTGFVND